jgi:FMN phosphatase YigB (HAD superfamily)
LHSIGSIFFQAEGTIVPSLYNAAIDILKAQSKEDLEAGTRDEVYNQVLSLSLGTTDGGFLCDRLYEMSKGSVSGDQFLRSILHIKAPDSGLLRVIDELSESYEVYLISQYPRDWLEVLLNRLNGNEWFKKKNILYCREGGLKKLIPDLFHFILRSTRNKMESCLYIDKRSEYLSAGLRMGFHAIVYVDAVRLRREFVLRGMLHTIRTS